MTWRTQFPGSDHSFQNTKEYSGKDRGSYQEGLAKDTLSAFTTHICVLTQRLWPDSHCSNYIVSPSESLISSCPQMHHPRTERKWRTTRLVSLWSPVLKQLCNTHLIPKASKAEECWILHTSGHIIATISKWDPLWCSGWTQSKEAEVQTSFQSEIHWVFWGQAVLLNLIFLRGLLWGQNRRDNRVNFLGGKLREKT